MSGELKLAPPQKVTIVESIIEQIVAQIRDGTLQPGDKLPSERRLIRMLGVSRSSVREALQGLAAMDLVETRPGGGTFIKEPKAYFGLDIDISTLSSTLQKEMRRHLNQARLILELGVVALAAERINAASAAKILRALEAYENSKVIPPRIDWMAHDAIHLSIAQATGNTLLVQILRTLLDMVPKSLRDKGVLHGSPEDKRWASRVEREIHRQLCEAVARGEAEAAREWMRRHAEHEEQVIDRYYGDLQISSEEKTP